MIGIITYNCHGMKNSIVDLFELCKHNNLIFLQEIWLFKFELNLILSIHPEFEAYGISAIKDSDEIINGRPYAGLAILIRKQYRPICDFQSFDDSRLLGVTISSSVDKFCFMSKFHISTMTIMKFLWNVLVSYQLPLKILTCTILLF